MAVETRVEFLVQEVASLEREELAEFFRSLASYLLRDARNTSDRDLAFASDMLLNAGSTL